MLKRDEIKNHVFKRDGITHIDEIGEQLIKNYYNQERGESLNYIANDELEVENANVIEFYQIQLQEKDNQINSLLNIINNHQKIQATQYLVDNQVGKKSFWGRFKRS